MADAGPVPDDATPKELRERFERVERLARKLRGRSRKVFVIEIDRCLSRKAVAKGPKQVAKRRKDG